MRQRIAVIIAIILTTIQFSATQEPIKKYSTDKALIEFATKNLIVCLHSENTGVVESALPVVVTMRMRFPSADMSSIIAVVNDLRKNHRNGAVRYKAFVTISVCENPEWYDQLKNTLSQNDDAFFHSASKAMNEHLLTAAK